MLSSSGGVCTGVLLQGSCAPQHSPLPDRTAQPHLRLLQQQLASIRKHTSSKGKKKQKKKVGKASLTFTAYFLLLEGIK